MFIVKKGNLNASVEICLWGKGVVRRVKEGLIECIMGNMII